MFDIVLDGCRPKPLASYLKAIGILKILSDQKDPQAKGYWCGESFAIKTSLSPNEFEDFFCNEYAPTPLVSPWNGGSGFYAGDAVDGINAILNCDHERFNEYRKIISEVRSWPEISSFKSITDVVAALNEELATTGSATEKEKLVGLLNGVKTQPKALSDLLGQDILQLPMEDVESIINRKDLPDFSGRKKWWNSVKKARTKATELKRREGKERILPICRSRLPESCVQWLDAVCSIQNDGSGTFSPLLGTGGNEGRFEFSNNFMQRLTELFIRGDSAKSHDLFCSAALNTNVSGLINASIGQYDPGRAGGYNQGMEVETKDFKINPWDFVLALEGSLVMASAIVRRNPTEDRAWLTVPFSVNFSPVGFASSAFNEKGRKELWIPIWRNPASYAEIKQLYGEGRASLGRRQAQNGIEFSRAVGTLGVDRGIESFERYAFLMRRGKSYVALPAGRIKARYKPKLEILTELDPITKTINGFLRFFKTVPASFGSAYQNIEEAVFRCSQDPSPFNFSDLVRSLGRLEQLIATRDRTKEPALSRPLLGLSPKWVDYADDGGVEVRIAAALASIRETGKVGPMRSNMSEVDPAMPWRWSDGKADGCWYGNDLPKRLGGVLSRRIMDATRRSTKRFPNEAHLSISCKDVMPFLWKLTDDGKIEDLLWGFCLIDWRKEGLSDVSQRWKVPVSEQPLARSYSVLKLLHSPRKIKDTQVRMEPRIINLLGGGRIEEACAQAVRRLHSSRLNPHMIDYADDVDSVRLIAAMLIPISDQWKLESLALNEKNS